jgi:hypothetical protein
MKRQPARKADESAPAVDGDVRVRKHKAFHLQREAQELERLRACWLGAMFTR